MQVNLRGTTYNITVTGHGEPLLLLHGFSGSQQQWQPFVENWSAQYQLIMVDHLGHGASQSPLLVECYRMEEVIEDLNTLLDKLDVNAAHILGYSMGGRIALAYAITYPQRVKSLILESSSPGLRTMQERLTRRKSDHALADRIEAEGIQWFNSYWSSIPLFASLRKLPEEKQHSIDQARLNNNPFGLAQSLRGIGTGEQRSYWNELDKLTMPVLLVTGALDSKYVHIAEEMKLQICQSKLEIVEEAGHNVHIEQTSAFDIMILQFLNKQRMV